MIKTNLWLLPHPRLLLLLPLLPLLLPPPRRRRLLRFQLLRSLHICSHQEGDYISFESVASDAQRRKEMRADKRRNKGGITEVRAS